MGNSVLPAIPILGVGSSPRAWGTSGALRDKDEPVHSHVHGELGRSEDACACPAFIPRAWGTPYVASPVYRRRFIPRAWGTSILWAESPESERFIPPAGELGSIKLGTHRNCYPTCRGTRRRHQTRVTVSVHPTCRGTVLWRVVRSSGRFIPTCMGNSSGTPGRGRHVGSSPRAWGTPAPGRRGRTLLRFIPTCMGNSLPNIY